MNIPIPTKTKRMKLKNLLNLMVLGTALTITAVGCKTRPQGLTPLPGERNRLGEQPMVEPGPAVNPSPVTTSTTGIPLGPGHEGWVPDSSMPLKAQTVYFDFDKSSIKSSEQSKLQEVADYMKSHPDVAVRVEGNCDERGTEEYNRSLGERRALAAREYLVRLGIDAGKIDTISYGNDKPAESGHSESAWSKNRRDDFDVLLPPKT
jgi:peptidoglycan-associated lipoprotein